MLIVYYYLLTVFALVKSRFLQVTDERIIGGRSVKIEDFPYVLSLRYNDIAICGAVLISPSIALSAAHCFGSEGMYTIMAGSSNIENGGQIGYIKQVLVHPGHDRHNGDNDIAILKLKSPLRLSKSTMPVKLPPENATLPPGTKGVVSGWGSESVTLNSISQNLRAVAVPILPRYTCENSYKFIKFSRKMFCAGYKDGGKDSCNGDSGGPYVVNNTLYGLVAFGISCADSQYPGVYTSIPAHRRYIRANCGI